MGPDSRSSWLADFAERLGKHWAWDDPSCCRIAGCHFVLHVTADVSLAWTLDAVCFLAVHAFADGRLDVCRIAIGVQPSNLANLI